MGDHLLIKSCCSVIHRNNSLLLLLAVLIHDRTMQLVAISHVSNGLEFFIKTSGYEPVGGLKGHNYAFNTGSCRIYIKPPLCSLLPYLTLVVYIQHKGIYDHHKAPQNFCCVL